MSDRILFTPTLAGVKIRLQSSTMEGGDHIATYAPPLSRKPDGGIVFAKLGRKATRIKLTGYIADDSAPFGSSAYQEFIYLQNAISVSGNRRAAERKNTPVLYQNEQGQVFSVFVESFAYSQKRQSIGIIDVDIGMVVIGDQQFTPSPNRTAAAAAAADTYFYERTPAPAVQSRLPDNVELAEAAADTAAQKFIAPEFTPPPTIGAFTEQIYNLRFPRAGPAYTTDKSDALTLSSILERVNKLRRIAIDLKTLKDDPVGALRSIIGNASDLTGLNIGGDLLPDDLPFTFDELLTIRAMWAAANYDPPRARELFVATNNANQTAAAPDDPNPVAQHLYKRDEYRKTTLRRIATAGKVLADIRGEFSDREDAEAEREITNAMLAAQAPELPVATARLRAASDAAYAELIPRLASVQTFDAENALPALYAAYRFTGDRENAAELARGNIVHLTCNPPFYA